MNISQPHLLWSLLLLLLILGPWICPSAWNSGKQVDKSNPSFNTFIESLSLPLPCFCQTSWALFTCSQMDILLQMSQNVCLTFACRVMSRSHTSCFSLKALLSSTSATSPAPSPLSLPRQTPSCFSSFTHLHPSFHQGPAQVSALAWNLCGLLRSTLIYCVILPEHFLPAPHSWAIIIQCGFMRLAIISIIFLSF